jgi:hypothetical protein
MYIGMFDETYLFILLSSSYGVLQHERSSLTS